MTIHMGDISSDSEDESQTSEFSSPDTLKSSSQSQRKREEETGMNDADTHLIRLDLT